MELKDALIDKKLVHKTTDENVFLYNLRREIPHFIAEHTFLALKEELSLEKNALLDRSYISVSADKLDFLDSSEGNYYMLKSIVPEISEEQAGYIADNRPVQDQAFLFLLYEPLRNENKLRLFKRISEEEEKQVLNILDLKDYEISGKQRMELSAIFENRDDIEKSNIVYANMFVNLNHDFFFEHSNDHVPGFMIIETFRQFCVSVNHVFGKVPVNEAQLVLECLDSKFFKYAELSLPIVLKGYIKECVWNKRGYWSYLDFEADAMQNNNILAHFRLYGKIITKGIFHRIRKNETECNLKKFRYAPVNERGIHFEIKDKIEKSYVDVKLKNISGDGFMLSSPYFSEHKENRNFDFFIYFEKTGIIKGSADIMWLNENEHTAGFRICEIDKEDHKRLKEAILKNCYVYERNEIL